MPNLKRRYSWHDCNRLRKNSYSFNILEEVRLQARRMSFDLNNGGAESPAPSKLCLPLAETFSAARGSRALPINLLLCGGARSNFTPTPVHLESSTNVFNPYLSPRIFLR